MELFAQEVEQLRQTWDDFLLVCPGIRPSWQLREIRRDLLLQCLKLGQITSSSGVRLPPNPESAWERICDEQLFYEIRGQGQGQGQVRRKFWLLAFSFGWHFWLITPNCSPQEISSLYSKILELSRARCETLTVQLLKDLPSYANRTSQRVRRRNRTADVYSYKFSRPRVYPP